MEYEIGKIADAFVVNTNSRIDKSNLDVNTLAMCETLQDELFKALRILENAVISKKE